MPKNEHNTIYIKRTDVVDKIKKNSPRISRVKCISGLGGSGKSTIFKLDEDVTSKHSVYIQIDDDDFDQHNHHLLVKPLTDRLIKNVLKLPEIINSSEFLNLHNELNDFIYDNKDTNSILMKGKLSLSKVVLVVILSAILVINATSSNYAVLIFMALFPIVTSVLSIRHPIISEKMSSILSFEHRKALKLLGKKLNHFSHSKNEVSNNEDEFLVKNCAEYLHAVSNSITNDNLTLIFDINESPKDTESIGSLLKVVDAIISKKSNIEVIFISKRKRLLLDSIGNSSKDIKKSFLNLIDVQGFTENESKEFTLKKLMDHDNSSNSSSIIKELTQKENTEYPNDKQSILDFLINGPIGRQSRLPITVNERIDAFIDEYGTSTIEKLSTQAKAVNSSVIELITEELAKKSYTDLERLFSGFKDRDEIKQSAKLLSYFSFLRKKDWDRLSPKSNGLLRYRKLNKIESIFETKERCGTDIEAISLNRDVKSVVLRQAYIDQDFTKIIKELISSNILHLNGLDELDELDDTEEANSLSISLLVCIESFTYLNNFQEVGDENSTNNLLIISESINKISKDSIRNTVSNDIINQIYLSTFKLIESIVSPRYIEAETTIPIENSVIYQESIVSEFEETVSNFFKSANIYILTNEIKGALNNIEISISLKSSSRKGKDNKFSYYRNLLQSIKELNNKIKNWEGKVFENTIRNLHKSVDEEYNGETPEILELINSYSNRHENYEDTITKWSQISNSIIEKVRSSDNTDEVLLISSVYRKYSNSVIHKIDKFYTKQAKSQVAIRNIIFSFIGFSDLCIEANSSIELELKWHLLRFLTYSKNHLQESNLEIDGTWHSTIERIEDIYFSLPNEEKLKLLECFPNYLITKDETILKNVMRLLFKLVQDNQEKLSELVISQLIQVLQFSKDFDYLTKFISYYCSNIVKDPTLTYSQLCHLLRISFSALSVTISCDYEYQASLREVYLRSLLLNLSFKESYWSKLNIDNIISTKESRKFYSMEFNNHSELISSIVLLLSKYQSEKKTIEPGDFIFSKTEQYKDDRLFFVNSLNNNTKITVQGSLLSIDLFHQRENMPLCSPKILVARLNNKVVNEHPATLKGGHYVGSILQLFFPLSDCWTNTNPSLKLQNVDGETLNQWVGSLWMGASNSWAVLRTDKVRMSLVLTGSGKMSEALRDLMGIRRLTVFEEASNESISSTMQEIKHFTNAAGKMYIINQGLNDEIIYTHRQLKNDNRKNRTFISMFKKIFDNPVSIYGWDNGALLSDDSPIEEET